MLTDGCTRYQGFGCRDCKNYLGLASNSSIVCVVRRRVLNITGSHLRFQLLSKVEDVTIFFEENVRIIDRWVCSRITEGTSS